MLKKGQSLPMPTDGGKTADFKIDDLKYVVSKATLLIGNDTGPSHMSWALNIPSILLFGPTPIERMFQTVSNKALKSNSKINHMKLDKKDFSIKAD